MNKKTSIAFIAAGLIAITSAFAWYGETQDSEGHEHRSEHCMKGGRHHGYKMGKRGWAGHKIMEREFTADQIGTLTKARLIMRGNENLKLGKVTSTENGYNVTIVTQDNSLVKEQQLAKNGMPVKKFERLQKRIEARKAKASSQ
ncbi:hypothetical protein NX722_19720 [Endozoicomonas gorgoniicola]|uniref:Uncharacterized protein n=1 Tax=Endozoicomonas gorgoniicola TaxID=1234144 RepID=A0ABT3MZK9_9GAMM|nr:hypothetical protein [Endozoicomonas gorgoniicola]MCW7554807.1 hypothetical protein [Endozoicomonas gorgoniicola]